MCDPALLQQAHQQVEVLGQLLALTPCPEDVQPDIPALQGLVDQRQLLLAQLPGPPHDSDDDPELAPVLAEAQRLLAELARRDQAITATLRRARQRVLGLMSRVEKTPNGRQQVESSSWIA